MTIAITVSVSIIKFIIVSFVRLVIVIARGLTYIIFNVSN